MVHSEGWRVSNESGDEGRSVSREHPAAARAEGGGSSGEPRGLGAAGGAGFGGRRRRARWCVAPAFTAWAVLLYACGTNNSYYVEQHIYPEGPDAGVASPAP